MQRLDRYINLCSDLMQRSHVAISCSDQMSISSVGFPSFAVQYFSIFGNLYLSLPFSVGFPVFCCETFLKIGILHLRMLFWVGFPNSVIGYFLKLAPFINALEFCIYDCLFGLNFLIQSQYFPKLTTCILQCPFWWISGLFSRTLYY